MELCTTRFIPQNIAPKGTNRIICFDESGKRVGRIGLYGLSLKWSLSILCSAIDTT